MKGVNRGRFVDLHGQGKKLCRLVAGGALSCIFCSSLIAHTPKATLHIIPLIAFAGLKSKVREMTMAEINEVARVFRTPSRKSHVVLLWLVSCSPIDTSRSFSPGSNGKYPCKDFVGSLNFQLQASHICEPLQMCGSWGSPDTLIKGFGVFRSLF